jgi:hypothetical protein
VAQSIVQAVLNLQSLVGSIDGVRKAPDYPPEQANVFPFAVSFCGRLIDSTMHTRNMVINLYEIITDIHVARKDSERDIEDIAPFMASFSAAVWADSTLSGAVSTTNRVSSDEIAEGNYGGQVTLMYRFRTEVKVLPNAA